MNMFISTWVLLVAGLVFSLPMIYLRVKNHTDLADETLYAWIASDYIVFIDVLSRLRMDDSGNILDTSQARHRVEGREEK